MVVVSRKRPPATTASRVAPLGNLANMDGLFMTLGGDYFDQLHAERFKRQLDDMNTTQSIRTVSRPVGSSRYGTGKYQFHRNDAACLFSCVYFVRQLDSGQPETIDAPHDFEEPIKVQMLSDVIIRVGHDFVGCPPQTRKVVNTTTGRLTLSVNSDLLSSQPFKNREF